MTVGGPKTGAACVFPFTYNGVTYSGCPVDLEDSSKRWCSTQVDAQGNHVVGKDEYGHCAPDCPVHNEAPATGTSFPTGSK